MLHEFADNCN